MSERTEAKLFAMAAISTVVSVFTHDWYTVTGGLWAAAVGLSLWNNRD